MSTTSSYTVYRNYPVRHTEKETGIIDDFRSDVIRTVRDFPEALKIARSHRLNETDYVYVVRRTGKAEKTLYYRNIYRDVEREGFYS